MNKYILLYIILISTNGFINSNIVTKNINKKKIYYKNDEFNNINKKKIKKAAIASGYIKYIKELIQETFIHPKDCFLLIKILYAMYPRKQKKCLLCNERPNNGTYCEECKL